jgi:hypothetical protein
VALDDCLERRHDADVRVVGREIEIASLLAFESARPFGAADAL